MATTTTLANNVLLPGPPILLTQAQTPAPYSPSPAPCLLHTPVCPAGASFLLSSVLLPGSCPGILPPPCLCLHLHCRQTPPVQHLCHHELPLLPEVGVSCLPPKASVGFEGSGFAYQQKGSIHAVPLQNADFPSAELHIKSESREISISNKKAKNFQNI